MDLDVLPHCILSGTDSFGSGIVSRKSNFKRILSTTADLESRIKDTSSSNSRSP